MNKVMVPPHGRDAVDKEIMWARAVERNECMKPHVSAKELHMAMAERWW